MNSEQRKLLEVTVVILCCFGIYTYTATLQTYHYCDWTGLKIEERYGHEVTFTYLNGSRDYYCCINISLLAFQYLIDTGQIEQLDNVHCRCAMCGMNMAWDDPMNVWVYQPEYLCPTTGDPTIVVLCEDVDTQDLCESHFLDRYGGDVISCPFVWP